MNDRYRAIAMSVYDKTLLPHDGALRDIYQKLLPLLSPPPESPRRQIGFSPSPVV